MSNAQVRWITMRVAGAAAFTAAALLVVVILAGSAAAHSFLVSTTPAQGERLTSSPQAIVLEFSEPVDLTSVTVRVSTAAGDLVGEIPIDPVDDGRAVRGLMPAVENGIFLVSWQAQSAVDGHGSAGELAFAVGTVATDVPATSTSNPTEWSSMVSTWLFVAGIAAAAGAMLIAIIAGDQASGAVWVGRVGLLIAAAGAAVALTDSSANTLGALLVLQILLAGLVVVGFGRSRLTLTAIGGAVAVWSADSHSAEDGFVGWLLDVVHLGAGAAWLGSLAFVVVLAVRMRRSSEAWTALVAAYARVALWFVIVLGAAGTVAAWRLVPGLQDLWRTRYGQLVVAKSALFVAAVGAAAAARWIGLARQRRGLLRRSMTVEFGVVAAAALVAGVLTATAPVAPVAASSLLGPAPMTGDVARDAGLAGNLTVSIAGDGERLDVRAFVGSGPVAGTEISVSVIGPTGTETDLVPRPCGTGCLTQALDLPEGTSQVRVTATAPAGTGGTYEGSLTWPPGELAPDRLQDVIDTMRAVPELSLTETVDSGPGSLVSPAVYTISGDRLIDAEPYAAANVDEVRQLPGAQNGLSVWVPGSQFYAELELDALDRIIAARMVDPGHLITRTITYPDR